MMKKRIAVCFLLLALLVSCLFTASGTTDFPISSSLHSGKVRVCLTRLALTDRLDFTVTCPYTAILANRTEMRFGEGSSIAAILKDGVIYLYMGDMAVCAGSSVQFIRDASAVQEHAGITRALFTALYEGDLLLDVVDGKLRAVLQIDVESYLLGVLPYEMGDSFPLEALKAQAVAARTYALRKANPGAAYDVVDTTNDQVFYGYTPGSIKCEKAVAETAGICGTYKNKLALCYYSASNGGQTELVETVWPTEEDFGYYAFGEDPYDYENPLSVVLSYAIQKHYSEEAPLSLRRLLSSNLAASLEKLGYDASPESIRVDEVQSVSLQSSNPDSGKYMTSLSMTVLLSGRTKTIPESNVEINILENGSALPETPQPEYGEFETIPTPFEVTVNIFPDAERAFLLDISGNFDNELWSVTENENAFTIQVRRFGHGVGMSQRGAQQMAGEYQKTFEEILHFYYPGMTLMRLNSATDTSASPDVHLSETAGPVPTFTPRPTLMPVSDIPGDGQYIATVSGISEDSTLNLRAAPTQTATILMRLYYGQQLLVLESCEQEGWVHVKTDSTEGYVMSKFLSVRK